MQNSCELRLVIGKMKRLLAICVCFFMCVGLCSCDSSQTRSVSSYNWSLEFITDLDGNMLFSGSVHDDIPVLDLTLSFEEKSFILTDNTHKQEWTGTYSLEKIDNSSSKLGLTFENLEAYMEQEFILMIQKAQQLHYKLMKISCLLLEKIHK